MEKEEIIEGNKLIATFLGYKYYGHNEAHNGAGWKLNDLKRVLKYSDLPGKGVYLCRNHNELRFFNSWDWLMLAVDRIEDLQYRFTISTSFVRVHTCKNGKHDDSDEYNCTVFEGKLKCTWHAVVEFIKWHNSRQDGPQ